MVPGIVPLHVTFTLLDGRTAASTIMQEESPNAKVTSIIPEFAVLTAICDRKPHTIRQKVIVTKITIIKAFGTFGIYVN